MADSEHIDRRGLLRILGTGAAATTAVGGLSFLGACSGESETGAPATSAPTSTSSPKVTVAPRPYDTSKPY